MSSSMSSDPSSEYETGAGTGAQTGAPTGKSSSLFDLRTLIGALFTLYGVVLTIAGFFTSDAELKKADDININLWLGLGMLVLGLIFLAWMKLRPLQLGPAETDAASPSTPGGH